jgi:hypothetical protein
LEEVQTGALFELREIDVAKSGTMLGKRIEGPLRGPIFLFKVIWLSVSTPVAVEIIY